MGRNSRRFLPETGIIELMAPEEQQIDDGKVQELTVRTNAGKGDWRFKKQNNNNNSRNLAAKLSWHFLQLW